MSIEKLLRLQNLAFQSDFWEKKTKCLWTKMTGGESLWKTPARYIWKSREFLYFVGIIPWSSSAEIALASKIRTPLQLAYQCWLNIHTKGSQDYLAPCRKKEYGIWFVQANSTTHTGDVYNRYHHETATGQPTANNRLENTSSRNYPKVYAIGGPSQLPWYKVISNEASWRKLL